MFFPGTEICDGQIYTTSNRVRPWNILVGVDLDPCSPEVTGEPLKECASNLNSEGFCRRRENKEDSGAREEKFHTEI